MSYLGNNRSSPITANVATALTTVSDSVGSCPCVIAQYVAATDALISAG